MATTKPESQSKKVLNHLISNGSITSWDAIKLFKATRLSSIIFNLKKTGLNITSVIETKKDVSYSRYYYHPTVMNIDKPKEKKISSTKVKKTERKSKEDLEAISLEDLMTEEYGKVGTKKRAKADAKIEKIRKDLAKKQSKKIVSIKKTVTKK